MNADFALQIERLGKCFYIPEPENRKTRGALEAVRSWPSRLKNGIMQPLGKRREFWALRDINHSVRCGTILGIIGANGAGKSTLLKIIARISPPTEGRVRGAGRVVSLLELGAGFNPEVSARENVIMNAAMYGLPRAHIEREFDEIVAFAEIDQFVDTPLRFYSSGMYLRLAFSVAIHMDPQILLADEILAVGDLAFQERCITRIGELARDRGLTVLFVSHDMEAVLRLCSDVVWLHGGRIEKEGDPEEVVTAYQNAAWARADAAKTERGRHTSRFATLVGAKLITAGGKEIGAAPIGERVAIRLRFVVARPPLKVRTGFDLTHRGGVIFRTTAPEYREITERGSYEAVGTLPAAFLTEINYGINAFVLTIDAEGRESSLVIYNAVNFMGYDAETPVSRQELQKGGLLAPQLDWTLTKEEPLVQA
jgi:lipopolysaccharide transport system ATP-binding protein